MKAQGRAILQAIAAALLLAAAGAWGSGCGGDSAAPGGSAPDGATAPDAASEGGASSGSAADGATSPDATTDAGTGQAGAIDGAADTGATGAPNDGSPSDGGSSEASALPGDGGCGLIYGGGEMPVESFQNLAVDATNVYFLTADANPIYHVVSCPKTGCGSSPTVIGHAVEGPVAVDSTGGIYWMDQGASGVNMWSIRRCAGVSCPGGPTVFDQQGSGAIVSAGGRVYWLTTTYVATCTPTGNCSQQFGTDLFYDPGADGNTTENPDPFALATDGANLYWVEGYSGTTETLYTSPVGATATPRAILSDATLNGAALTASPKGVVWAAIQGQGTSGRGIYFCPASGCSAKTTITTNPNGFYNAALAADAQNVYFAQEDNARAVYGVYKCPITGCTGDPVQVMPTVKFAVALALDDTALYIHAQRETAVGAVPELWACPK